MTNKRCLTPDIQTLFFLIILSFPFNSDAGTYNNSAHGNTTTGVSSRTTGYLTGNCAHCHDQHASRVNSTHTPYTALRGLSEENLCEDCHDAGGPATDDIQSQINKTYSHPVDDAGYADRHTTSLLELNTASTGSAYRSTSRHVECADCHEPHTAQTGNHELFGAGNTNGADNNLISNALEGVWGVEPTSNSLWTPATTFTEQDPATKEYQICFKCHSYYAFQDADGITSLTSPSGATITDQAMEFSKGNRSVHPVRTALDNQTGSYAPKKLTDAQMATGWKQEGTQTMYCSDCHGSENSNDESGPHGSSNAYLLKGENGASNNYAYWPTEAANGSGNYFTLKRIADNTNSSQSKILCKKCHNFYPGGSYNSKGSAGFYNFVHEKHYDKEFATNYGGFDSGTPGDIPCIACHTPVIHGSKRSRLIGYITDAAPYTLTIGGETFPVITKFKKAANPGEGNYPGTAGYDKENCIISNSICGSHNSSVYTYD